jgi:ABC-type transport system involved in cytochrome c biogenesis permease component
MSGALQLLRKDLRLLLRGKGILAILVGYPLVIAALVTVALQSGERRPAIAFVNLDTSDRTVRVGDRRLGVADYEQRLAREVDLKRLDAGAAAAALEDGRVSAVLTLPANFIRDLQTGIRTPTIDLQVSRRSPIEAQSITRRMESAVYRFNQELAGSYVKSTLDLVRIIVEGGDISVFTREGSILGLRRSETLVRQVQRSLIADDQPAVAARLDPLLDFIIEAGVNLDLADAAATAISRPIVLTVPASPTGREPLSSFGLAGALLVSLALVGLLLAAAALSAEREDNTLVRLRRGLVGPEALVAVKVVFAAIVSTLVGLVLLAAVALGTSVAVDRWVLWLPVLIVAGLAFGAFGVLIGAAAKETRSALLAALMIALPFVFLGLFTNSTLASGISQVLPFGPAFRSFQTLLVEPSIAAGDLWLRLGQLLAIALVLGTAAAMMLRRRSEA